VLEGEARVDDVLRCLLEAGEISEAKMNAKLIGALLAEQTRVTPVTDVRITEVLPASFDELLGGGAEVLQ
jgi:hypothetical protein